MTARRGFAWLAVPVLFVAAFGAARAIGVIRSAGVDATTPVAKAPSEHHFEPWDLMLDSAGTPLAAWQVLIEPTAAGAAPSIVGIEGGDAVAYAEPPAYDPAQLDVGRIVLGAFSLRDADALPQASFHAATVHFDFPAAPTSDALRVRVEAAADPAGNPVRVQATLVRRRSS